jgi:hypothetical protein
MVSQLEKHIKIILLCECDGQTYRHEADEFKNKHSERNIAVSSRVETLEV